METAQTKQQFKMLTEEERKHRLDTAEQQILNGEFIPAVEAHRIMRSHILGLD